MKSQDNNIQLTIYKHIYIEYAPALVRFAKKFGSTEEAKDLVHDLFIKLWDKQIFFLPEDEVKRILYVSLRNLCINHIKKLASQKRLDPCIFQLQLEELHFYDSKEDKQLYENQIQIIMNKIEELPEQSKKIFKMSYIEGMKASEIATQLNISIRTVENHLYRSLTYLRKHCSKIYLYLFICFFS